MPKIVALALVTSEELSLLGPTFSRAYPIDEAPCFTELVHAIDLAEREICRERDQAAGVPPEPVTLTEINRP